MGNNPAVWIWHHKISLLEFFVRWKWDWTFVGSIPPILGTVLLEVEIIHLAVYYNYE
jgi:hypothetical protein